MAERWWENFLVDEEKINLREIQAEKPMESLSQEEQMKIYQMMFDQRQKAAGLPTSEEQVASRRFSSPLRTFSPLETRRDAAQSVGRRRFAVSGPTVRPVVAFFDAQIVKKLPFVDILLFRFQMDEKRKAFRRSTTGVKAERRKKKNEGDEAKRRNPKAFSIQNPVKAQQEFRR